MYVKPPFVRAGQGVSFHHHHHSVHVYLCFLHGFKMKVCIWDLSIFSSCCFGTLYTLLVYNQVFNLWLLTALLTNMYHHYKQTFYCFLGNT
jgi:hypothetical protein